MNDDLHELDPMRAAMRAMTTLPRPGKPAADLTDQEKLALFIAAGAPIKRFVQDGHLKVETLVPCGVADRGDGGYFITIGSMYRDEGPFRRDILP